MDQKTLATIQTDPECCGIGRNEYAEVFADRKASKNGVGANARGISQQAAVGFEPTNNGFAIRRLDPLGYAADSIDIRVNNIQIGDPVNSCTAGSRQTYLLTPGPGLVWHIRRAQ